MFGSKKKFVKSLNKAVNFAGLAHNGQLRKSDLNGIRLPYIVHPIKVAVKVYEVTHGELEFANWQEMVIAALLHDVVEDTKHTLEEVRETFGEYVANLVKELTSDSEKIKEIGKAQYLIEKMDSMHSDALIIKLCDRIDNISNLKDQSNEFSDKYCKETETIIENLDRFEFEIPTYHDLLCEIEYIISDYKQYKELKNKEQKQKE